MPEAKLWSAENPFLYTILVRTDTDELVIAFGIRKLEWNAEKGLTVNGQRVLLRGGCIHHDHGVLGACEFRDAEERRIRILKENGFNAVRIAHNPASQITLETCDKLGMYNKLMDKQMTISAFSDELAQVRTKKKEFLSQIERIVPWGEWLAMIQPCYYKGERGNKPYPLEIMLRLYLLQNLYDLSDEATVAEAIDSRAFSEFCSVDSSNQVPDGDTLGRFRNLLIRNGLQEKLFAQVVTALMERGLILKKGTIVDSTIISAPSSTKNKEKKRDPDAHQVKKGNTWHFGYKAHIGVDKDSGLVHTVKATAANVHDVSETSKLLTGEEEAVYGDSGYLGAGKREDAVVRNKSGHKIKYKINRRPSQVKKLSKSGQYAAKKAEHAKSSVRAKVEHVFGVVKKQLHFRKTRYRGLEKQQAKFNIMFALANLILADRPCLAA